MLSLVFLLWEWGLLVTRPLLSPLRRPNARFARTLDPSSVAYLAADGRCRTRGDDGQTTAEYALMLIAAAAFAIVCIGWITKTDAIAKLFDTVMSHITTNAG